MGTAQVTGFFLTLIEQGNLGNDIQVGNAVLFP